jgi:DNA polymerase-3 subunit epsilon
MRQIVLDTETTGLSPETGDRIVEIGCLEIDDRRITQRHLHRYVNPERPNNPEAVKVHGLTDEFLADKPRFASLVDELLALVQGAEIIIHNAPFDVGFLDAELARLGRGKFTDHVARVTDSLAMARNIYPGKANSLDALCRRLEVDNSGRTLHGALLDAQLLAEVYLRMTRGQGELVIDPHGPNGDGSDGNPRFDFSSIQVVRIPPTPEELEAHERTLKAIDKESGGKTIWRRYLS